MILQMFSLLDMKTGAYTTPWFQAHAAQAIRAVSDLVQDQSTTVARHPADFSLVLLGSWDDQTGAYTPQQPTVLGVCASFLPERQVPLPFDPAPGGERIRLASPNGMEPHGSAVEV